MSTKQLLAEIERGINALQKAQALVLKAEAVAPEAKTTAAKTAPAKTGKATKDGGHQHVHRRGSRPRSEPGSAADHGLGAPHANTASRAVTGVGEACKKTCRSRSELHRRDTDPGPDPIFARLELPARKQVELGPVAQAEAKWLPAQRSSRNRRRQFAKRVARDTSQRRRREGRRARAHAVWWSRHPITREGKLGCC